MTGGGYVCQALTLWLHALQARTYEEATTSMLGWYLRNAQTRALSHPLPVLRAREIDRWGGPGGSTFASASASASAVS